jgi:hypothetical protein
MLASWVRLGVLAAMVSPILFAVTPVGANLFVSSANTNQVLEYDDTTGAFINLMLSFLLAAGA